MKTLRLCMSSFGSSESPQESRLRGYRDPHGLPAVAGVRDFATAQCCGVSGAVLLRGCAGNTTEPECRPAAQEAAPGPFKHVAKYEYSQLACSNEKHFV